MLQVFHKDVTKVDRMLHMLQWAIHVYFKCFICFRQCCKCFI
jgi:hypothetical protein